MFCNIRMNKYQAESSYLKGYYDGRIEYIDAEIEIKFISFLTLIILCTKNLRSYGKRTKIEI